MTNPPTAMNAPARRSGVAVWRRIADTLSLQIRNRAFTGNGRVPSEAELANRFGVNRHTLRQAVGALQTEGLLRIEKGRGMFVQHELMKYTMSRRTRFSENLRQQGLLPGQQLLTARSMEAPERVAAQLKLARKDTVLLLETVHEADGQPVNLATADYPARRFGGLLEMLDGTLSVPVKYGETLFCGDRIQLLVSMADTP